MKEYSTCEISKEFGLHPNTIRFYEEIGFLPQIPRKENGYRIYNEVNLEQLKLIRIGLKSELLQNGLRKEIIKIIKTSANGNYDEALELSKKHFDNLLKEEKKAKDSIEVVEKGILYEDSTNKKSYTRK